MFNLSFFFIYSYTKFQNKRITFKAFIKWPKIRLSQAPLQRIGYRRKYH